MHDLTQALEHFAPWIQQASPVPTAASADFGEIVGPVDEGQFDHLRAWGTFELLIEDEDFERSVGQAYRILKPGGMMIVVGEDPPDSLEELPLDRKPRGPTGLFNAAPWAAYHMHRIVPGYWLASYEKPSTLYGVNGTGEAKLVQGVVPDPPHIEGAMRLSFRAAERLNEKLLADLPEGERARIRWGFPVDESLPTPTVPFAGRIRGPDGWRTGSATVELTGMRETHRAQVVSYRSTGAPTFS